MMDSVPYSNDEIFTQCRAHLANISSRFDDSRARFVVLQPKRSSISYAVKIDGAFEKNELEYERAFMDFLQSPPTSYRFPKTFGIIEDEQYAYLVMEYLEGPTLWQVMREGAIELPESDADDVVTALRELHNDQQSAQKLLQSRSLTPLGHWHPQGFIFAPDGDGGRLVLNLDDFISFMTIRFNAAEINMKHVPLDEWTLAHGDVTPENFIRCTDGRLGIVDCRTTFLAPSWWEAYALRVSGADPRWLGPLEKAMKRQKMNPPEALVEEMDKFPPWFCLQGGAYGR